MNKDIFKGNWNQSKGKIQQAWSKLTDDDLMEVEGNYNELVGRIQKKYGLAKEDVEKKINEMFK